MILFVGWLWGLLNLIVVFDGLWVFLNLSLFIGWFRGLLNLSLFIGWLWGFLNFILFIGWFRCFLNLRLFIGWFFGFLNRKLFVDFLNFRLGEFLNRKLFFFVWLIGFLNRRGVFIGFGGFLNFKGYLFFSWFCGFLNFKGLFFFIRFGDLLNRREFGVGGLLILGFNLLGFLKIILVGLFFVIDGLLGLLNNGLFLVKVVSRWFVLRSANFDVGLFINGLFEFLYLGRLSGKRLLNGDFCFFRIFFKKKKEIIFFVFEFILNYFKIIFLNLCKCIFKNIFIIILFY